MIRFTLTYLRPVALFLSVVVLFQCCKVYQKNSVTVEQAIGSDNKRVKIITVDDKKLIFDSLYYRNNDLIGLLSRSNKKQLSEVIIKEGSIKSVHLLNLKKSRTRTILLVVLIPVGVGVIYIGAYIIVFGVLLVDSGV
jgi:hypothetical protein